MKTYIWKAGERGKNETLLFWLEVQVEKDEQVRLSATASGTYKAYVNGQFILQGPTRAAKGYTRVDGVDVALQAGKNHVAVLVTDYGVATYNTVKNTPFFACELQGETLNFDTTHFTAYEYSARVKEVQRYSFQRGFGESYVQEVDEKRMFFAPQTYFKQVQTKVCTAPIEQEKRIRESALVATCVEDTIWRGTFFEDESAPVWDNRCISLVGNCFEGYTRSELVECLTDYPSRLRYENKEKQGRDFVAQEYGVYDFGRNMSGFLGAKVTVEEDATLYLLFDELLDANGRVDFVRLECANVVKWELKAGEYGLQTLEPYTARYAQIVVKKGKIRVENVNVTPLENADAYNVQFTIPDKKLAEIMQSAQYTLAQNAVDLFMDCPSRERAGWINDVFFTRHSAEILMGNNRVEKNTLENFAYCGQLAELPTGMIPMCYPSEHLNGEYIPNCAMWYVIIACEYCQKTGDTAFADVIFRQVQGIIDFFAKYENEYGLLEELDSWIFVEWSQANDREFVRGVNFPTNMMYCRMLEDASALYGQTAWADKAKKLKDSVVRFSYNGEFFEDNCIRIDGKLQRVGHVSEACQYHAFTFGFADERSHPALYQTLMETFTPKRNKQTTYPTIDKANIITGLMMRETWLLAQGQFRKVAKEIVDIYGVMAERTKTLWENVAPKVSCNHGCASYAGYLIVRCYTGLRAFEKGQPVFQDGYLGDDCRFTIQTPNGTLEIVVQDKKRSWTYKTNA